MDDTVIFWFRRDLRLQDNAGLYHALRSGKKVLGFFLFDREILDKLEDRNDARVTFLHRETEQLKHDLNKLGSDLLVLHDTPVGAWKQLIRQYAPKGVYTNRDYEPDAIRRDKQIADLLEEAGIPFSHYKDQVVFDRDEVLKEDGTPYIVYTPYSKAWKQKLTPFYLKPYPTEHYFGEFLKCDGLRFPSLEELGFHPSSIPFPSREVSRDLIRNYHNTRDIPGMDGTSRLSLHFRFGTVSIREKAKRAQPLNEKYFNELIWREFYQMILYHYPEVVHQSFKKVYDRIEWQNDPEEFERWKTGNTGFPLVDAGMRELLATGYMHNRVRMVVASFLCKHLLIDWRWGERWFARKLLDYDLASNNGGWQWAAGTGVDAAPYFRVFNPWLQQEKFDKDLHYVKKWVPEYGSDRYVKPMVDHAFARQRCLERYKVALNE